MLVEIIGKRYEEKIVTTSRKIAEGFEKRHSDVLRDIENLGCSEEFRQRNYALSSYTSEQNKRDVRATESLSADTSILTL